VAIKAGYLLAAGGGGLLLWSGFTGRNWTKTLRAVIQGQDPTQLAQDQSIITSPAAYTSQSNVGVPAHGAASATGMAIAQQAQQYIGSGYVWGGAPGSGSGNWDCSSFTNAVVGRDMGLAIPLYKPGTYHGQSHGPTTGIWLVWSGAFTIHRQDAAPGDLAVWQTHMGIFVSNSQIVSALNQSLGTRQTTVSGAAPFGEKLFVRRLKAVTAHG